ncbi:uncharacterized protein [Amphiura filiformis]|uniref:uncharacterized protein n=1 Tax=Amphiura filiformis TaxID=82378 RepID=UPI003B214378
MLFDPEVVTIGSFLGHDISVASVVVFNMDERAAILYLHALFRRRHRIRRARFRRKLRDMKRVHDGFVALYQRRLMYSMMMATALILTSVTPADRSFWCKARPGEWWNYAYATFNDTEWRENFRVKRSTFDFITRSLGDRIRKRDTSFRKAISVEKRVAVTLWRLSTNAEYRTIGHLFGIGRNTACVIVRNVCKAIKDILTPRFITIPRGQRLLEVIDGFENRGFPHCVGAIDGTHIPIIAPTKDPADFYNRKGWHSIIVQAVCDHEFRFTNLYIGFPGKAHDARVLKNSQLYEHACNGQLFPHRTRNIEGVEVPLYLVGDPAYPLLPWLMKAYPGRQLPEDMENFNDRLADVRKIIEQCFGRCKARFRCLLKRNDSRIDNLIDIVYACFTLNNICEIFHDGFDPEWLEDQDLEERVHRHLQPNPNGQQQRGQNADARDVRDAIKDYLLE